MVRARRAHKRLAQRQPILGRLLDDEHDAAVGRHPDAETGPSLGPILPAGLASFDLRRSVSVKRVAALSVRMASLVRRRAAWPGRGRDVAVDSVVKSDDSV